ncbi:uncharacterized protein LOC127905014 isoform X4 [Populus trichocarpa]|uniref:uncharacterized protein LOC127905014 isoform X4 n=1 Tax=Populus trichocarpa TaxID=3694 RepID=UPI002277CF80|nr:uncharacterized protein LOC127905014 isoform X4 [Populus trichocarpa]
MPAIIFAQRMKIQMNFAFGSVSLLLRRRDALKHKVFMQVCIFLLLPAKEILDLAQERSLEPSSTIVHWIKYFTWFGSSRSIVGN